MKIKLIHLINFQKHADLVLNFQPGVNILYGSSDSGKSCIRRSIDWVLFNAKIDGVRKSGTKNTVVSIVFDNDIEIIRERSVSVNRYSLRKNKLSDIIVFDAIGKTIPQEIKDAIGIEPIIIEDEEFYINSAPQLALPFLFDKSPTWRMKLFNKLTGNDLLDTLFVSFNKDVLGIGREIKVLIESLPKQEILLQEKETEVKQLKARYQRGQTYLKKIDEINTKHSKLLELTDLLINNEVHIARAEKALTGINIPQTVDSQALTSKIEQLDALKSLYIALHSMQIKDGIVAQLKEIRIPDVDLLEKMGTKIDLLEKVKVLGDNLEMNAAKQQRLTKDLEYGILDIQHLGDEFKTLLKEAKTCPLCLGEISDQHIAEIHL